MLRSPGTTRFKDSGWHSVPTVIKCNTLCIYDWCFIKVNGSGPKHLPTAWAFDPNQFGDKGFAGANPVPKFITGFLVLNLCSLRLAR
jgi:hypothetical protein